GAPGAAGAAVAPLDVVQSPLDLRRGVRAPVGADAGHLRPGEGLRDAVRAGGAVVRAGVPAALAAPQVVEALPLILTPAPVAQHLLGDSAGIRSGVGLLDRSTAVVRGRGRGTARLLRHRPGADEDDLVDGLGSDHLAEDLAIDDLTVAILHAHRGLPLARTALRVELFGPLGSGRCT